MLYILLLLCALLAASVHALQLMATYLDSSQYPGNDLKLTDPRLNYSKVSHLLYGHFGIDNLTGNVSPNDVFSTEQMVNEPEDAFCYCCVRGHIGELYKLKRKYSHLHTVMILGGLAKAYSSGVNFTANILSNWTATNNGQLTVAKNLVTYMVHSGFDGIAVDWNFNLTDASKLLPFLINIRNQLNLLSHPQSPQHNYSLSLFLSNNMDQLSALNISAITAKLDLLHIKAYGTMGNDKLFRHSMAIDVNPNDPNPNSTLFTINGLVNYLTTGNNQVPLSKLVVSLGFEGRAVYNVNLTQNSLDPLYRSYGEGPDIYSYKPWSYNLTTNSSNDWIRARDVSAGNMAYYYHRQFTNAVSMPDKISIQSTMSTLYGMGIYGVDAYHLAQDSFQDDQLSLWNVMTNWTDTHSILLTQNTFGINITLCIPSSTYCNVRCNAYCYQYRPFHYCNTDRSVALTYYVGGENGNLNNPARNALMNQKSDGLATYFFASIGPFGFDNIHTIQSAYKVFQKGHTIGVQLYYDPAQPYTGLSDQDFENYIKNGLSKISKTIGKRPNIIRFNFDDQDRTNDRFCRILGSLNMSIVSWNVDVMDWNSQTPQSEQQRIVERFNTTIYNSFLRNTTTSFISLQIDALPTTVNMWDSIQSLTRYWNLRQVNLEQCVATSRSTYTVPTLQDQNPGCDISQITTDCVTTNSIMLSFIGLVGSYKFYNLTENMNQRGLTAAVFVDASELRSNTMSVKKAAIFMVQKLFNQGFLIGQQLLDDIPTDFILARLLLDAHTIQDVIGQRPRFVRIVSKDGGMRSFDSSVCTVIQQAGFRLIYGTTYDNIFDLSKSMATIDSLAPFTKSFITSQLIQYIPNEVFIQALPATGDWLNLLQTQIQPRSLRVATFDECMEGSGKLTIRYNSPSYECGDGKCYTRVENCINCPRDCSCDAKIPTADNPFLAQESGTNNNTTSTNNTVVQTPNKFLNMLISRDGIVVTSSVGICIVMGVLYVVYRAVMPNRLLTAAAPATAGSAGLIMTQSQNQMAGSTPIMATSADLLNTQSQNQLSEKH